MKPFLILTPLFLLISETYSQVKEISIPITEWNNTYDCYEDKKTIIEKISQTNLINSVNHFHFRLWLEDRALEIWENNKGEINGLVFFWANEYISNRTNQQQNTYSKTFPLNPDSAKVLKALILSSKLEDIPTDVLIKGWQLGDDGITYSIE